MEKLSTYGLYNIGETIDYQNNPFRVIEEAGLKPIIDHKVIVRPEIKLFREASLGEEEDRRMLVNIAKKVKLEKIVEVYRPFKDNLLNDGLYQGCFVFTPISEVDIRRLQKYNNIKKFISHLSTYDINTYNQLVIKMGYKKGLHKNSHTLKNRLESFEFLTSLKSYLTMFDLLDEVDYIIDYFRFYNQKTKHTHDICGIMQYKIAAVYQSDFVKLIEKKVILNYNIKK